jgi:hypothetical protein
VEPARGEPGETAPKRSPTPGCGCGGWAVLIGLIFVVMRLVGACDASTTQVSLHTLDPGDCLDWPAERQGICEATLVDCSSAHGADAYPGSEDRADGDRTAVCLTAGDGSGALVGPVHAGDAP